jgi:hypothetical protein
MISWNFYGICAIDFFRAYRVRELAAHTAALQVDGSRSNVRFVSADTVISRSRCYIRVGFAGFSPSGAGS